MLKRRARKPAFPLNDDETICTTCLKRVRVVHVETRARPQDDVVLIEPMRFLDPQTGKEHICFEPTADTLMR